MFEPGNEKFRSFIVVNFGYNWDNIAVTRRYIDEMVHNETKASNAKLLSAAASELMENACKYSCYGGGYIAISIYQSSANLKIMVMNVTTDAHIRVLEEKIKRVLDGDPEQLYKKAMLESLESGKSQLGLAKIRYECNASITLKILDHIPDCLVAKENLDVLYSIFKDAKAIEVSVISTFN